MRVWFSPIINSLLPSVYFCSAGFIFYFLSFLWVPHCSPFVSGLTPASAAPSPAGFSDQESCAQIQWFATKPAMTKKWRQRITSWPDWHHTFIIFLIQEKMVLEIKSVSLMNLFEPKYKLIIFLITTLPVIISTVRPFLLGIYDTHYLWQILGEMVTEGSKGLATYSQVIAKTTLVQALRGEQKGINNSII